MEPLHKGKKTSIHNNMSIRYSKPNERFLFLYVFSIVFTQKELSTQKIKASEMLVAPRISECFGLL